jgi:CTP synthase (UTP-ammonia lyase)
MQERTACRASELAEAASTSSSNMLETFWVTGMHSTRSMTLTPQISSFHRSCSLAGREMMLGFVAGSKVAKIYGALEAREKYYCNFGVNPDVVPWLKQGPMKIVGSDHEGEIRVLELPDHPFFIATLFVPQLRARSPRSRQLPPATLLVGHNGVPRLDP